MKGTFLKYLFKVPDTFYDISEKKFRDVIKYLDDNGFEIGLYASYLAYKSKDFFDFEKNNLEKTFGKRVVGNRHHYWHMNPKKIWETSQIHAESGLLYDTSVCLAKHPGFRYSICSPFHFFNQDTKTEINCLELPSVLMDDHLFGYRKYLEYNNYEKEIDVLVDAVKKYNGLLVLDYHVRVFNSDFFPDWLKSYEYIIKKINEASDYYCDTPENIAKYWLNREKQINGI